jgi:hypothetical protein
MPETSGSKQKILAAIGVLVVLAIAWAATSRNTSKNAPAASRSTTAPKPTAAHTQAPKATPDIRSDLAFKPAFTDASTDPCHGYYESHGAGQTLYYFKVEKDGDLVSSLTAKNGTIYRHDDPTVSGQQNYTAPVDLSDVSSINGNLYIGGKPYACAMDPSTKDQ